MANRWGNSDRLFWGGSKITADGDYSQEIKRCLLLGRKVMTNLDNILKSQNIILPAKVHLLKAIFFSSNHVWMLELDYNESWAPKNWCFCWRTHLREAWTARRSNKYLLKEISPEYSLEGLMVKLKLPTLATWCEELTYWKRSWCWKTEGGREGDDRGWDGWMASPTQ